MNVCTTIIISYIRGHASISRYETWSGVSKTGQNPTKITSVSKRILTFSLIFSQVLQSSSSASWSRFSPHSNFVNGHVSTIWFMVCRWPKSQEGYWARPHLCKLARRGSWPVRKRFIRDHVRRGRSKPGCRIVWSVTIVCGWRSY